MGIIYRFFSGFYPHSDECGCITGGYPGSRRNVWACLVIATTGNWLGGLTSYWIGWLGRWEWIERWLKVKEEKLLRQKKNIDRYGVWLALFTWLPLIGDLLAVALGFYKIKPYASAIYMLIGRFARFLLWTWLYLQYGERFF
ncbi:MAG: YqaA family protein [Odoribacter splanchnicus]